MNFLFVVNNYPPSQGGVQIHVANLAESLVRLGNTCIVVTLGNQKQEQTVNGVTVISIPGFLNIGSVFSFPRWGTIGFLKKLIQKERIDCVSVHTRFFPLTWLGIRAADNTNTLSIITEHGSDFVRGVSTPIKIASRAVDWTLGRWALRTARKRLAISGASQKFVKQISGKESSVFFNAIQTALWVPTVFSAKQSLVFIGRLVPDKGWRESVYVFNTLAEDNPGLTLDIFGSGPETLAARELVEASPHKDRIQLYGSQPATVIKEKLSGAVLLNPTRLAEGFQTTLLEAFASGTRIVTYKTPGISELLSSGAMIWESKDLDQLVEHSMIALKAKPAVPSKESLKRWDWVTRAHQFQEIAKKELSSTFN